MTTGSRGAHSSRDVANYILEQADAKGIKLTLMQLLKLLYIAHGWSLVLTDTPLLDNQPQAWQYGPVYPHVYKAFSKAGANPIPSHMRATDRTTGAVCWPANMSAQHVLLVDDIIASYGKKHAFELSNITHKPQTPWAITFEKSGPYKEIAESLMLDHYSQLKAERNLNESRWKQAS